MSCTVNIYKKKVNRYSCISSRLFILDIWISILFTVLCIRFVCHQLNLLRCQMLPVLFFLTVLLFHMFLFILLLLCCLLFHGMHWLAIIGEINLYLFLLLAVSLGNGYRTIFRRDRVIKGRSIFCWIARRMSSRWRLGICFEIRVCLCSCRHTGRSHGHLTRHRLHTHNPIVLFSATTIATETYAMHDFVPDWIGKGKHEPHGERVAHSVHGNQQRKLNSECTQT
mmetsp:Transcript_58009/g.92152  ORF Transcript_58009/g.92152 Transcript_58009/m.92152 type:complete len:225 (+) Transcript_58009:131-805(+)